MYSPSRSPLPPPSPPDSYSYQSYVFAGLFSFEIKFAYTEKHISLCFDKCKHSVTSIFTEKKKLKKSQPLSLSKDIQVN